jgi:hypothetical protein
MLTVATLRTILNDPRLLDSSKVVLSTSEESGPRSFQSECENPDGAEVVLIQVVSHDGDAEENGWITAYDGDEEKGKWAVVIAVD